jgi:hypothetical protein
MADFWSQALGCPVAARFGPFVLLERRDGVSVGFQAVPHSSPSPGRIHLDLAADDPGAERVRVEALGATRAEGYEDGGFLVMADPEGNIFCIVPSGPFEVDDGGRAGYAFD